MEYVVIDYCSVCCKKLSVLDCVECEKNFCEPCWNGMKPAYDFDKYMDDTKCKWLQSCDLGYGMMYSCARCTVVKLFLEREPIKSEYLKSYLDWKIKCERK